MRVSVIIVSYNVYPFLDNCLRSVQQAMTGIEGEIIVIDNASVDRTPQYVAQHFPDVKLIANQGNVGFAKANNQGIQMSKGEFVLLLNPDTILSENTIHECISYMDTHSETGAIGVKMIDGSGRFLPESKRGLPTLRASFMKMTGLYHLNPRSEFMNSYYQGHIDENETDEIEVLCGAFMFIRKSTLQQSGYLDEDFFMYGEDIDLSYRIRQTGKTIVYLPTTRIIHYKGESTRKSTLNYILTFYQAMLIFTRKHPEFSGQQFLIKLAIYLHGFVQFVKNMAAKWWPLLLDAVLWSGSFLAVSKIWAIYYHHQSNYFTSAFYYINLPLYTAIALIAFFLNGAYDKPFTKKSSWMGFGWAIVSIVVIYAMLPILLRSSRMVLLMGFGLYLLLMLFTRWKFPPWKIAREQSNDELRKAIIVAEPAEANRIKELINRSHDAIQIAGIVSPGDQIPAQENYLGPFSKLDDIVRVHQIREIIYSAQDVPFSKFTGSMSALGTSLRYMLAASTTMNIVGSMSSQTEGESYAIRINFKISQPAARRAKRLFDVLSSLIILVLSPVLFWMMRGKEKFFSNIINVITGNRTWISYHPEDALMHSLPTLKPGVLSPANPVADDDNQRRMNHIHYVYARDYHWTTDLSILVAHWQDLGKAPLQYAG